MTPSSALTSVILWLLPHSGAKTGRCPRDKRVVREASTEKDIWWASTSSGSPNYEMDERSFLLNRETAVSYLNSLHHVFVFDGYANWDPEARIKVQAFKGLALMQAPPCAHRRHKHSIVADTQGRYIFLFHSFVLSIVVLGWCLCIAALASLGCNGGQWPSPICTYNQSPGVGLLLTCCALLLLCPLVTLLGPCCD